MGLLDVHARSWHAPSRTEQIQKAELRRLEDAEHEKKRQIKHEIETLKRVEEMQHDAMQANRELLSLASRRRAVSGIDDRQRLALLEREREARLRNNANTQALLHAAASPHLGIPGSPVYHGTSALGVAASPRVRTVSASHGLGVPGSPIGLDTMRGRTVSTGMSPAAIERMRLEERKRALVEREAALQHERENRLRAKKSALELADRERHLRERQRELQQRNVLNARDNVLDREEALLHAKEREMHMEDDIDRRLRNLNVNFPSLASLTGSPRIGSGHARQLSTPLAVPMHADGMLHALPPSSPGFGHSRSRSHGGSPLLGSLGLGSSSAHLGSAGLDEEMLREAARLGIPLGGAAGGVGGLGSPAYGSSLGVGDRNALLNHAGVSPRLAAYDDFGADPYGELGAAGSLGRRGSIGSLNGYDSLGGSRSRRGSLTGGLGDLDAYGDGLHGRRDSLPFEERPLFDTRGY